MSEKESNTKANMKIIVQNNGSAGIWHDAEPFNESESECPIFMSIELSAAADKNDIIEHLGNVVRMLRDKEYYHAAQAEILSHIHDDVKKALNKVEKAEEAETKAREKAEKSTKKANVELAKVVSGYVRQGCLECKCHVDLGDVPF